MPLCRRHSMIADEQGAQHVWSRTRSASPGAVTTSEGLSFTTINFLIFKMYFGVRFFRFERSLVVLNDEQNGEI